MVRGRRYRRYRRYAEAFQPVTGAHPVASAGDGGCPCLAAPAAVAAPARLATRPPPAQTKQVQKETHFRGKRELPYADSYADF
jgi:hypothetical protein